MNPEFKFFPESASTIAQEVDALYYFTLAVSAFFSLLIAILILFFFVRYRRKLDGPQVGAPIHGSILLEITWSVIPLLICLVMFVWGAKVYFHQMVPPEDATEYFATAKQWMWKFQHPTGEREINTLHVPIGEKIKITMTSEDVIHSFYVPAFRVKKDVVPGRYSAVWFEATKVGKYHLFCAEYCGAEHSKMIGSVYVMSRDDYQAWLAGGVEGLEPAASGEALFEQYACQTCHEVKGSGRGPSLYGIAGKEVGLTNGNTIVRDDDYLRESILRSGSKIVSGYQLLMPTYQGQISEENVLHLIAYIKTLGTEGDAPAEESSETIDAETGS